MAMNSGKVRKQDQAGTSVLAQRENFLPRGEEHVSEGWVCAALCRHTNFQLHVWKCLAQPDWPNSSPTPKTAHLFVAAGIFTQERVMRSSVEYGLCGILRQQLLRGGSVDFEKHAGVHDGYFIL